MKKNINQLLGALCALILITCMEVKAGSISHTNDSINYSKNILKFAPLSFIPYNLMPCFSIDYEHRHSSNFSSQITAGLFIANSSKLDKFPGIKAAYEVRFYMNKNTDYQGYLAINSTFISQNAMTTLRFQDNSIDSNSTTYGLGEVEFTIHRDVFINTLKLGYQVSISERFSLDNYIGFGIMYGHNIYYKENKDAKMISTIVNPFALSQIEGDFWCPTFLCNMKLCYKI